MPFLARRERCLVAVIAVVFADFATCSMFITGVFWNAPRIRFVISGSGVGFIQFTLLSVLLISENVLKSPLFSIYTQIAPFLVYVLNFADFSICPPRSICPKTNAVRMFSKPWTETFDSEAKTVLFLYLLIKGRDYAYNISNILKTGGVAGREGLKLLARPNKVSGLLNEMERDNLLIKWSDLPDNEKKFKLHCHPENTPSDQQKQYEPVYFVINKNVLFLRLNYIPEEEEVQELLIRDKADSRSFLNFSEDTGWIAPSKNELIYRYCGEEKFTPISDHASYGVDWPRVIFDEFQFTDAEILKILTRLKKFDYFTVLLLNKQFLIHIIAVLNNQIASIERVSSGLGIQIDQLPQSESGKRKFVERTLDQMRLVRPKDITVDQIIHEIYAKSQRDIRQYSTLFSFIDSKRTFESTVISCHDPMDEIEGAPQSGFVINDQRVYEELLIFNDSLISTGLERDRVREGES